MIQTLTGLKGIGTPYNAAQHFIDSHIQKGRGHKTALYYRGEEMTYGDLAKKVNRFGNALKEMGIDYEERILIVHYDTPEFVIAFFGAVKIGAVPVPVNTMMTESDYEYFLNNSRAKALVIHQEIWEKIRHQREKFIFLEHIVVISDEPVIEKNILDFHAIVNSASPELEPFPSHADDTGFWLYTSGSTGAPKGVVHLQHDMYYSFEHYARGVLDLKESDITFSASKLYFAYGLGNGMYFPLGAGASTILMAERPVPEKVFEYLQYYRPTVFFGVPTLYGSMLDYVEKTN